MLNSVIFNKISSKLENLEEYLKILKEIQKVNRKSFVNDYHCDFADFQKEISKFLKKEKNFKAK